MPRFDPTPQTLAVRILSIDCRPLRVAIDGIDCSGKTTLADLLGSVLEEQGSPVIRVGADRFLRPPAERYRLGEGSPAGYARDSVDYRALRAMVLDPLGPGGDRRYRTACRDEQGSDVDAPWQTAPEEAVVVVDGVFLQRPELRGSWDVVVWVDTPFVEALRRALLRDADRFGGREAARSRYLERYQPGQRLYLEECRPAERADIVVRSSG